MCPRDLIHTFIPKKVTERCIVFLQMKKDFTGAMTLLEAKLNSVRSTLAKERVERENIEQKYCTIAEENESLKTSLKSRQEELGEALEGNFILLL
jgi:hypothetical protein